jgi:hypothetical protein
MRHVMRLIQLGALRSHGVPLSARESVAVLHEVCRLSHAHAQAGHWFPAPQLADLSLSELGDIVISPSAIAASRPSSDSLTHLIDELLPTDLSEASFPAPRPSASGPSPAAGDDDTAVLQALFARACATGLAPWLYAERTPLAMVAAGPELRFFDPPADERDDAKDEVDASSDNVVEVDHQVVEVDYEVDHEAIALYTVESRTPDLSTEDLRLTEPSLSEPSNSELPLANDRPWVRRAVLCGLGLNVVLGIAIVWPLVPAPGIDDLLAGATGERAVETGFDPPAPPAARASAGPIGEAGRGPSRPISTALLGESDAGARPVGVVLSLAASRPIGGFIPSAGNVSVPGVDDADDATVSPDGQLVAFVSDRDGERGVFVAHRNGQKVTRASGEGRASAPAWAPDARRLAFVRAEADRPTVWNLWMRNMTTGELAQLTSHDKGIVRGASWFPDGRRLCYGHGSRLLVLDVGSRRAHPVSSPVTGGAIRTASVSPDGERIAFDVEGDGIWLLDVARGSMERVADEPAASGLTWAPKGNRLLYYSLHAREWRAWQRAPAS